MAGSDSDFEVDLGESLHLQSDARLAVYKIRPEGHEVPVVGARLHNGAHAALQRDLGEDVVVQVAQHSAGVASCAQRR